MKKNKFSKALKHIKKDLNEVAPTNSMSGVYSLNDPGYSLRHPSGPKTFRTDKDGNFPSGIPGTPGSPYIRPGGIWTGEQDWDEIVPADFSHNLQGADGNSTDGLIGENGVVYSDLPPGSRSYILGPLVDGFVRNHAYDAYTRIGYIQKDTRQFVLLAKIFGTWKEGFVLETGAYRYESGTYNYPVWDGTTVHASTGFHTYGSFTLADAQWMRAEILAGKYVKNAVYRNSGGIQQTWNYYASLPGLGIFYNGVGVGAGSGDAADNGLGGGGGYGQGGNPTIGTQQTDPPKKGDAEDAGFPWFPFGNLGKKAKKLWDNITDGLGDIKDNMEEFFNDAFDDSVQGAKDFRDSLQDALNNAKSNIPTKSEISNWGTNVGNNISTGIEDAIDNALDYLSKPTPDIKPSPRSNKGKDTGVDNASRYTLSLAAELPVSIVTGQPREIKVSKKGGIDMANSMDVDAFADALTLDKSTPMDAENTINPKGKTDQVLGNGWDIQGGATFNFNTETGKLEITANKTLRTTSGGERVKTGHGDNYETGDWQSELEKGEIPKWFSDIPELDRGSVDNRIDKVLKSKPIDNFLGGLSNIFSGTDLTIPGESKIITLPNGKQQLQYGKTKTYNNGWDFMKDHPKEYQQFKDQLIDVTKGTAEGLVQGTGSNAIAIRHALQNFEIKTSVDSEGWKPFAQNSDVENIGGAYGQVSSKAEVNFSDLSQEVQQVIIDAGYDPKKFKKESLNLRKVKFVMEDVAAAPAPTTPTNQTTTQQPTTEKTDSKQTADALAKEYIEKNGPEKTKELIDKTDEYLSAHGQDPEHHNVEPTEGGSGDGEDNTGTVRERQDEIISKMGPQADINNISDDDFQYLIDTGYPLDDLLFGGKTGSPVGDLVGLGLTAAAIKFVIPALIKAGGSIVKLWNYEWGQRVITDAAWKTFQTTGQMPPFYHWAFWKLLPQPILNVLGKISGGKLYSTSLQYTKGTLAGTIGLNTIIGLSAFVAGDEAKGISMIKDEYIKNIGSNLDNLSSSQQIEDRLLEVLREVPESERNVTNDIFMKLHDESEVFARYDREYKKIDDEQKEYEKDPNPAARAAWDDYDAIAIKHKEITHKLQDEYWETQYYWDHPEYKAAYDPYWNYTLSLQPFLRNNSVQDLSQSQKDKWDRLFKAWVEQTDKSKAKAKKAEEDYFAKQKIRDDKYYKERDDFYNNVYLPAAGGKAGYGKHKSANEITQGFKDRKNELGEASWLQDEYDRVYKEFLKGYAEFKFDDIISSDPGKDPDPGDIAFGMWGKGEGGGVKINSYQSQHYNWYKVSGDSSYLKNRDGTPFTQEQIDELEKQWQEKNSSLGGGNPNIASNALGVGDETTAASVAGERKKKKKKLMYQVASYKPKGRRLQESDLDLSRRKVRMLKEIKKPVLVEELPQQKLRKYKPNFKGKYSPQNTPDKTASKESDALVMSGNQKGQAWRIQDKYWSGYESQERMNIIQDRVGHGEMAWDMIIDEARRKNGWKNREIQEQLNQIAAEKGMKEQVPDYESPFGYVIHEQGASTEEELDTVMKDPLVKKVAKRLRTQIDYKDKPSRQGFPDEPPAKQQDGWHPEYGKKYKYDKLDPQSAEAMPPTGNPEIDANVEKAKPKKPRWKHINTESKVDPKVKWQESVDWRQELKEVTKDT